MMVDDYSYTEYNEEKNKIPWGRILIISLIFIVVIVGTILFLKSCSKTSLKDDLLNAANKYFELYPNDLPNEIGECFSVTASKLENEVLINSSDYKTCNKDNTYVNVCYLENKTHHYSVILECEDVNTNYGAWKNGVIADINEDSDIKFQFLGETLNDGIKYFYPNDLNDALEVKEYYATSPSDEYAIQEDEQIGYKWYTENTVDNYWNNGAYSSTQPSGYNLRGTSTTVTKYSLEKPSDASYRDIEEVQMYRSRRVAYPASYTCSNPNNPDDVIISSQPCSGTHFVAEAIIFTCNGTDVIDVTAEQILNRDFPACGEWSEWTTKQCSTSFTDGISCQTANYKYTDTMWKWYRKDKIKIYYPSGSSNVDDEDTYYISSPVSGAVKDISTETTVYKYYKLKQDDNSMENWIQITDNYVDLMDMISKFRELGYEVNSLSDINELDETRYKVQMQYRNLEE